MRASDGCVRKPGVNGTPASASAPTLTGICQPHSRYTSSPTSHSVPPRAKAVAGQMRPSGPGLKASAPVSATRPADVTRTKVVWYDWSLAVQAATALPRRERVNRAMMSGCMWMYSLPRATVHPSNQMPQSTGTMWSSSRSETLMLRSSDGSSHRWNG